MCSYSLAFILKESVEPSFAPMTHAQWRKWLKSAAGEKGKNYKWVYFKNRDVVHSVYYHLVTFINVSCPRWVWRQLFTDTCSTLATVLLAKLVMLASQRHWTGSMYRVCPPPCLSSTVSVLHRVCPQPCLSSTVSVLHSVPCLSGGWAVKAESATWSRLWGTCRARWSCWRWRRTAVRWTSGMTTACPTLLTGPGTANTSSPGTTAAPRSEEPWRSSSGSRTEVWELRSPDTPRCPSPTCPGASTTCSPGCWTTPSCPSPSWSCSLTVTLLQTVAVWMCPASAAASSGASLRVKSWVLSPPPQRWVLRLRCRGGCWWRGWLLWSDMAVKPAGQSTF